MSMYFSTLIGARRVIYNLKTQFLELTRREKYYEGYCYGHHCIDSFLCGGGL